MGINESISENETGLELDKIDLSDILFPNESEKKSGKGGKEEKAALIPIRRINAQLSWIIGGIALSLLVVFLLWGQTFFELPLLDKFNPNRKYERIATIGPVLTSFGKNEYIKLTVQIECKDTDLKEKIMKLERRFNDKFMLMLNQPDIQKLVLARDFDALKPLVKKEVEKTMAAGSVENIYFSQITLY